MERNHVIILVIIMCMLIGNVVYALVTGEREPFLYAMNNKMNYESQEEEIDVAENDPVILDEDIELSTEATTEQDVKRERTTEQTTQSDSTKSDSKKGSDNNSKKKSSEESEKKSDENSDNKSNEEGDEGENEEGGNDKAVNAKKLVDLICTWKDSDKLLYGKDMKTADIHVTGEYDNGDRETIPIENCTIKGFDSKKLGNGTCTISYYGLSKNISYKILNYELSIFCDSWDKRYQYRYGDSFSASDIVITANMADGSRENVSDFDVSGIAMESVGEHVCTISYKSFTLSENYSVKNYPLSISSSITKFTVRGTVPWDDIAAGQTFIAEMADGTKRELSSSDYQVSGFSSAAAGNQEMTVSYDGVSIAIPYTVYYDSLKIDMGSEIGKSNAIHFTKELEIESAESLGLEKEYKDNESGAEYILEGIYSDSGYKNKFEFPKTYTANRKFRINSDGLPWHEYTVYAKYVKKAEEKKDN